MLPQTGLGRPCLDVFCQRRGSLYHDELVSKAQAKVEGPSLGTTTLSIAMLTLLSVVCCSETCQLLDGFFTNCLATSVINVAIYFLVTAAFCLLFVVNDGSLEYFEKVTAFFN